MAQTVDFGIVLKDADGTPLTELRETSPKDTKKVEVTLGIICSRALFTPKRDPEPGDKKAERGALAFRIYDQGETELTAEEIVLIKQCVGEFLGPIVVTQVFDILD